MRALQLLRRKIRSRLKRHALNHNLICRPLAPRLRRRGHNYFCVLNPIDHFTEDRVLLIERRLFLERDEPLTVGAVDITRARGAERSTLVRNVAELRRHIWIRRIASAPGGGVTTFSKRIAALNDPQVRVDPGDCRAIKELRINYLFKPFNVLRSTVRS